MSRSIRWVCSSCMPGRQLGLFVDFAGPAVNGRIVAAVIGRLDQHLRGVEIGRTRKVTACRTATATESEEQVSQTMPASGSARLALASLSEGLRKLRNKAPNERRLQPQPKWWKARFEHSNNWQ